MAAAVLIVGCGSRDNPPQWGAAPESWMPVVDPVTVAEGANWRFDVGPAPSNSGLPVGLCMQPVVANQALGCLPLDAARGELQGLGAVIRIGDERVIWQATTIAEDEPVDHFVVWSSAFPSGRRLDPITHSDAQNLLWIMEPGEAPWGHQEIASDGTLLSSTSYVGLSAD